MADGCWLRMQDLHFLHADKSPIVPMLPQNGRSNDAGSRSITKRRYFNASSGELTLIGFRVSSTGARLVVLRPRASPPSVPV